MKKTELYKAIKEEIIAVLSEADQEDITAQQDLNKELENTKTLAGELGDALSEEMDDDEMDKAASAGAKKEPLGKLAKKMAENKKEMQSVLAKYKKAEGKEKEKHLARLKELTKIKKELEKML